MSITPFNSQAAAARTGNADPVRRVRVLHIVTSMGFGGIETYVLNVLRHYDRTRFEMDVCYTGAQPGCRASDVTTLGSRLIQCRYTNALVPFVWRLACILRAGRYDAVCDFSADFAAGSMWAGKLAGVPTRIALYRNSRTKYRPTLARRVVAGCLHRSVLWHATSVLSNSQANFASAFSRREIDKRFAVVYNGVDLSRFVRAREDVRRDVRQELEIPDDALVVGHVGSFIPQKAQDVLLDAFTELTRSHPTAWLLFVGDGLLRPGIEQQAARLNVADRVTFAGSRHDVPRLLQAMDLFVMPSRFEGFPNALIEAQAVGLPIVASDRPEIREAVPPENHDCLARVDAPASFAEKMAALLGNRPRSLLRGATGASFVERNLRISHSVEEFCRYILPQAAEGAGARARESREEFRSAR